MSAVQPLAAPTAAASRVLTVAAQQITVGLPDVALSSIFQCGFCRRIVAQGTGVVFVQRQLDTAPISYAVVAGTVIDGYITLIGGSTNHGTATATVLNLEV